MSKTARGRAKQHRRSDPILISRVVLIAVMILLVSSFIWQGVAQALATTTITITSESDFGEATASNTAITGTGDAAAVRIAGTGYSDSWLTNWTYRQKITFQNSAQDENLDNFPVLVRLTSANIDYAKTKAAGADLRFTDSDGTTLLSYEIEKWNASGDSFVWVKVPRVNASSNADYIYAYYGNSGAADAQNAADVWSNGYVIVQHMEEAAGPITDSTSFGNNGSLSGTSPYTGTGAIGDARTFDGSSDYAQVADSPSLNTIYDNQRLTAEAWIKSPSSPYYAVFIGKITSGQPRPGWMLGNYTTDATCSVLVSHSGGIAGGVSSPGAIIDNQWHHVVCTYDGQAVRLYIDGQLVGSDDYTSGMGANTAPMYIGADPYSLAGRSFGGIMDEVNAANVARSDDWIAAHYKSLSGTFTTIATAQTQIHEQGTWESPSDSANVYDLKWNGGWGDGTAGSTAFTATVDNVGAGGSITFQMRTAAQLSDLTSASYTTLGTISSGTTFTLTKAQMDALNIPTGGERYVQVKALFTTTDYQTNPRLESFALTYQRDNTPPESPPSNLKMYKIHNGSELSSESWTNISTPEFTWNAATDSEADIKGYCLYLGNSNTGDPEFSKGLLGDSPVDTTGTTCQFIISTASINLATSAYRGGTWLTSDDAAYYFTVKPVDNANNIGGTSIQFKFYFDSNPPRNPSYISLPGGFIATEEATFTWPTEGTDAPADDESQLAGLQYRIGASGTWYGDMHNGAQDATDLLANDGSYTTQEAFDFAALQEGANLIYIRAWDNAGNVTSTYVTGALKINTTAPSEPQNLEVTPTSATTNSYAFNWDTPAYITGAANTISYCYVVNTTPSLNTCSFTSPGQTSLSAGPYATQPGTNIMRVVARDEAGNINYDTYTQVNFSYTGSAPGIPQNIEIADISIKAQQEWRLVLSWAPPQNEGTGVSAYRVYRTTQATSCSDGVGSFTNVGSTSGQAFTDVGLEQRNYYYCVQACDSANNCGAYSSTVNEYPDGRYTTPPVLQSAPSVSQIKTRSARINWTTDRDSDSRIAFGTRSGQYQADEIARSSLTTSHGITLTNLKPSTTYFFVAKWTDEDGNTGTSTEKSFTTNPAPVIEDVTVTHVGIDQALISFRSNRASKVKAFYGLKGAVTGLQTINTSLQSSSYVLSLTKLRDDRTYTFQLNPIDEDGFEYEGDIYQFKTLPRPRISGIQIDEIKGAAQPTMKITWKTNTGTTSVVEYYPVQNTKDKRSVVDVKLVSDHATTIPGLAPETQYRLKITGVDKLGNKALSDEYAFTTATDSRPPLIANLRLNATIVKSARDEANNAQILISWDTDEPSTGQVEYGRGSGGEYTQRSQRENNLTSNHFIVISDLQPSRVYHIRVISVDKAGNQTISEDVVSITPKNTQSALDLVIDNLVDVFSF